MWFKSSSEYRTLDKIDGDPMEFEWNIFPGFNTLQLTQEVQEFMTQIGDPSQLQGRITISEEIITVLTRYRPIFWN